jgi:hypothetical protein
MREAGGGTIINISSVAGKKGWANASGYCASLADTRTAAGAGRGPDRTAGGGVARVRADGRDRGAIEEGLP